MGVDADRELAEESPKGPLFWTAVVVGWAVMAFGVVGAIDNARDTHPRSLAIWIVGSLAVHDFVIAPVVFIFAGALKRALAPPYRAIVQASLIVSAVIVIVSIPVVGFGMSGGNASALPRNYAAGLLVFLGVVWAATVIILVLARRQAQR